MPVGNNSILYHFLILFDGGNPLIRLFLFNLLLVAGSQLLPQQASANSDSVQVGVTIQPLQLIAAAITDGVSEPTLILSPGFDPHHPVLRPSQRRVMGEVDVLLWVGPQLESSLTGVIDSLDSRVISVYTLLEAENLTMPGSSDAHVWLDTRNALAIARGLRTVLSEIDSAHAQRYEANLQAFKASMATLSTELAQELAPWAAVPFAVYHNAFQYYERQFGLAHVASFTNVEGQRPGVRRLLEIRQQLQAANATCLLLEPGVNPAEVRQLSGQNMRHTSVDVLATAFSPGPDAYGSFMRSVTAAIISCLQDESSTG